MLGKPWIGPLILALAATAPAAAHGPCHHRGHGGHHAFGPAGGPPPLVRLVHRLDLTDAQRERIRGVVDSFRTRAREQRDAIAAARNALRELDPERFDEAEVRRLAGQLGTAISELTVMRQELRSRIFAVLEPEQRAELREMLENRRGRGPCGPSGGDGQTE